MEIKASLPLNVSAESSPIKDAVDGEKENFKDDLEGQRDTVKLYQGAKTISKFTQQGNALPDVREDKVAEMKRRIAEGNYTVASDRIAGDLIKETIENNSILNEFNDDRE